MSVFEFGPFVLDPAKRTLLRNGVPQSLPPKAFDLLMLLVEQRGRVVTKEELLGSLWPETFVEEANLTQQVFVLRRTLNGDSKSAEYITTIPRRGYRFTAAVVERSDNGWPAEVKQNKRWNRKSTWLGLSLAAVVLLAAILAVVSRDDAGDPELTAHPVTALPGLEEFPSISPDGNFVVFSWTGTNPEGVPDLWIKAVDGEALRRLTETSAAERHPAWSPDGREIAFVRAGKGVFIVSALDGGQERQVMSSGSIVGWTPDSRSLLVRERTKDGPHGIVRVELATGARHQITRPSSGMGDWTFDVSPDGKTLAFVRYERPGISDVYTAPLAGGEARRRTNLNATISRVAWAPDGRDILYSNNEAVFRISADSERVDRERKALHVNGDGLSMSRPGPGRPGRLAFMSRRIDVGLRLVDLHGARGGAFESVTRFSDSTRVEGSGRFSPDGKQIAFASDRTGRAEAWIANTDGSGLRQATTLRAPELLIGDWSPDNRRVVIDAAIDGNSDVYVIGFDGGPPIRLTSDPGFDGLAEWSSDGGWIYFTSIRSGRPEVWKVSADGGEPTRLTRNGGMESQESADGQTLFYLDSPPPGAGGTSGTSRLMSVPTAGGAESVVLDGARFGLWSATENGIVFLTIGPDADAIDLYRLHDRTTQRLGTLPFRVSRIAGLGRLTVSRDGRWALVSATDARESDIMVVDGVR